MGKAKNIAIGTILAAAAGYVAGVLTAPKSGRETRQELKDKTSKSLSQAEKQLKQLYAELNNLIEEAKDEAKNAKGKVKDELDNAVKKTKAVKDKARELLSALHEGEADDKELRKAIDDANKAIVHLKSYLTKN